ncbi:MAG: choice-of-anchor V domain-containing protein [Flavobacteriales bacterium]
MKKIYILTSALLSLVFIAASNGAGEVQNRERTGTPDGDNPCSQCHSSSSFSPTAALVVTNLDGDIVTSYVPGETYFLSLGVVDGINSPSEYGFQMSVLDGALDNAGQFVNLGTQVQTLSITNASVMSRNVIEHSSPSALGVWQSDWVAPVSDVGDVTFYFSTVSANGNNMSSGDTYTGGTLTLAVGSINNLEEIDDLEVNMIQTERGIEFSSSVTNTLESIEIYTLTGRLTYSAQDFNTSDLISNGDLPSGIAIIVVNDGVSVKTFKTFRN